MKIFLDTGDVKAIKTGVETGLVDSVDIVTIPDTLFFQLFMHPLTDEGLAQFARDWKNAAQ
jgi:transaldolase